MRATISFDVFSKTPQKIKGVGWPVRIGFYCQRIIDLPFAPFAGLILEFDGPSAHDDRLEIEVESVAWVQPEQQFWCYCKEKAGSDTEAELVEDANFWEASGFTVDRGNLCLGRWLE